MKYIKTPLKAILLTICLIAILLTVIKLRLTIQIKNIQRGDLVTYKYNGQIYAHKVLAFQGEKILYKYGFYLDSHDLIYRITQKSLPKYNYILNDENLEKNSQKWFTIGKDELYVIKDLYINKKVSEYNPNSGFETERLLDIPGGIINYNQIISIKREPKDKSIELSLYNEADEKTKKPDKTPKIDLLYPTNITNKEKTTAIFKINLIDQPLIESEFLNIHPYEKIWLNSNNSYPDNYLYFIPSKPKLIEINLNGKKLNPHAFAIQPYIWCRDYRNSLEYSGEIKYESQTSCLENKQMDLLVFANLNLIPGANELVFTRKDREVSQKYSIDFDKTYNTNPKPLPDVYRSNPDNLLSLDHGCTTLTEAKSLAIPLIKSSFEDYYYKLSFPQSKQEYSRLPSRLVYFGIDNNLYEINLPNFNRFNHIIKSNSDLDLPSDYLYFSNWKKAYPSEAIMDFPYPGIYFEIIPYDYQNRPYQKFIMHRDTVNSSSCDG